MTHTLQHTTVAATGHASPTDSLVLAADTLATRDDIIFPAEVGSVEVSCWRDTTASAAWGTQSTLAPSAPFRGTYGERLTDNAIFQGFVLALAATYMLLLYHNLGDVAVLFRRITRGETSSAERSFDSASVSGFSRFLNIATAIGMLFMGVIVVKYSDSMLSQEFRSSLSYGAVMGMSLLVSVAFVAVAAFQFLALKAMGAVTLSEKFTDQLLLLKRTYFSLMVIITSPWLLLHALCPTDRGGLWFFAIIASLATALILYLMELFKLFMSKKISILHWFLYLCTVELFPVSLLCLAVAR